LLTQIFYSKFPHKTILDFSILQKVPLSSKISLDIFLEICAIHYKFKIFNILEYMAPWRRFITYALNFEVIKKKV